jgi:hypothetical protein
MTTNEQVLQDGLPKVRMPVPTPEGMARIVTAPLFLAGRLLLGPERGPRAYRREGFPEHEIYGLMSGRRDRLGS